VQLKPGVAVEPVLERLRVPFQANQEDRAKDFKGRSKSVIANFLHQKLILEPAGSGTSDMQKDYRSALAALGVLVALVLLIACANVANLMMAQAAARAREMALRVSIGAGRCRLVQLVLAESAILAVVAAVVGGWFAWWAAPFVAGRIRPPSDPAHLYLPADWRVLAFGLALTLCVTCLFGLAPALRASAVQPASTLKGGEDPHSRRRTMHSLIALQVCFCFVVLFLAGLFVTTSGRLSHQSTGFSSERLLTLETVAARPQRQVLWDQVADHLRATPGVEKVAISAWPLLSGNGSNGFIMLQGVPAGDTLAYFLAVSPGWLDTMRIPFVDGRDFRADDASANAAIVNEAFAGAYFNGEDPVGKWFERPQGAGFARYQIVGLVRDARYRNMREPITPTAYVPLAQSDPNMDPASETYIVRTASANPLAMGQFLRREVPRARSEFRVSNIGTQRELVEQQTLRERLLAMLGYFFAGVALLLAGIGLYGVLDYSVLQRRREIGIRMAIGAQAGDIARGVTADAFVMVLAGAVAGLVLGESLARYIASLLYQVKPGDAAMLVYPACLILAAALAAAVPAVIRAVRIDPIATLRQE
jgi:predicted permease